MRPLPPHSETNEDKPLHETVHWLASTLGGVIRRLEGPDGFEWVERLRIACRARREGESGAPDINDLLATIENMTLENAGIAARAFTLFFMLINTAEQVHQVQWRRRQPPEPGNFRWAFHHLKELGITAEEISRRLSRITVRPVLTAHPTEATRHTVLDLQARVADLLLQRDGADDETRMNIEATLEAEIELLWLTAEVREDRPSVMHEVSNVLWYLKHRFPETEFQMIKNLRQAYSDVFGSTLEKVPSFLCIGSWVGGDRDGNPNVTPAVTIEAARRAAETIIDVYKDQIALLVETLSWSEQIRPVSKALKASLENDRRDLPEVWKNLQDTRSREPLRLKLGFVTARLDAKLKQIQTDAKNESKGAYRDAESFVSDLELIGEALKSVKARRSPQMFIDPLVTCARSHGFYGYTMDVRQESGVHEDAIAEIYSALGKQAPDRAELEAELSGREPLLGAGLSLKDHTDQTIRAFDAIRRIQSDLGEKSVSTYIISMTHGAEDLLRVLMLAREAGLVDLADDPPRSSLDVVPLFETLEDLKQAGNVMRSLFESRVYRRQLQARGMRQEIMIGYSDSTKDAGLLPASWALYRAQETLSDICNQFEVFPTFFHGKGGTVGRGGGSTVFGALSALPRGSVGGSIKITEQGEVISQKYGLIPVAEHTLEMLLTGTLMTSVTAWCDNLKPEREDRYREVMGRLVEISLPVYRKWVHEDPRLFELFLEATPVEELSQVHFGSRPAYRGGHKGMGSMRAIPWVFGWTQCRLNLPAWLGVGTALSTVAKASGGLEILQEMADSWCFFDDLLGKIEMICTKTDMDIARAYIERLGKDGGDLEHLFQTEYALTVDTVLKIRRSKYLLDGRPHLRTAIMHRDRYLDPLSMLQIHFLRRKRSIAENDPQMKAINRILGTTLNGIAQGLRNTG